MPGQRGRRFSMTEKLGVKAAGAISVDEETPSSAAGEGSAADASTASSAGEASAVERVKVKLAGYNAEVTAAEGAEAKCAVAVTNMRAGLEDPLFFASVCDMLSTMCVGPEQASIRASVASGEGGEVLNAALATFPDDPNVKFHWMKLTTILASDQHSTLGVEAVDQAVGLLERSLDDAVVVSQTVKALKNFCGDETMRARVQASGALDLLQRAIDDMGGNAILAWRLADLTRVVEAAK